jgi:hypothetical protein
MKDLCIRPRLSSSSSQEAHEEPFTLGFLAAFPHLSSLRLETDADPQPLALCTSLRTLNLQALTPWAPGDASPPYFRYQFLSALTQLTQLEITLWGSLAPLAHCKSLASLSVSDLHPTRGHESFSTFSPALACLTALTYLSISSTSEYRNRVLAVKPYALSLLQQLQELYLNVVHDGHLIALSSCPHLTRLIGTWRSDSLPAEARSLLSSLQPLTSLKTVCLRQEQELQELLPPFRLFPSVTDLSVILGAGVGRGQYVRDVVRHCPNLRKLHAGGGCKLSAEMILLLQQLPDLRSLMVQVGGAAADFEAVAKLTQLTKLHIHLKPMDAPVAGEAAAGAGGPAAAGEGAGGDAAGGAAGVGEDPEAGEDAAGAGAWGDAAGGAARAWAGAPTALMLFPLLQLRRELKHLHMWGPLPPFSRAEAHAFVFGWGKAMHLELDYEQGTHGGTRGHMTAAVKAWRESQGGELVPLVSVTESD